MRSRFHFWMTCVSFLLLASSGFAQQRFNAPHSPSAIEALQNAAAESAPPLSPMAGFRQSERGSMSLTASSSARPLSTAPTPENGTVMLPLSAGLSIISIPVRTPSDKLSDVLTNLPAGSRAWIWSASDQRFIEGFDNALPLGQACWLYLPVPTVLMISGQANTLTKVTVDMEKGWNLIGVPYTLALPRAAQYVYVDHVKTKFNDAVAANAIGPNVYSLDVNGFEAVGATESFQPMHGYWVYSDGSAQSLELGPQRLQAFGDTWWGWGMQSIGSGIIGNLAGFGVSTLLHSMGVGNETQDALNQIIGELDHISKTQDQMNGKLDSALNAIQESKLEILGKIGDATYVTPVQNVLTSYYDQSNANQSLKWFADQAAAGNGKAVTMSAKTDFAKKVLNDWAIIEKFNLINTGINPAAGKGLLDNFADQVVLSSTQYDLQERYVAMQSYFNTLLGLQIKCATLIMNSYTQLGDDPATAAQYPAPKTAADWKKNVFDPTMRQEVERFRQAVEQVAVAKLQLPSQPSAQAVVLPDYVQTVLGMADFFAMHTLNPIYPQDEPAGLRVRLLVNPGSDVSTVQWRPVGTSTWQVVTLPSMDKWLTVNGVHDYDNWTLSSTFIREFTVTKDWKLTRFIVPMSAAGKNMFLPLGKSAWWDPEGYFLGVVNTLDDSYAVAPTGTPFGSTTFVTRPYARDMFLPCYGGQVTTEASNGCANATINPDAAGHFSPCDTLKISNCMMGSSWTSFSIPFTYKGTAPATTRWVAQGAFDRGCYHGSYRYQVYDGTTMLNELWGDWSQIQQYDFTFQPGHSYKFRTVIQGDGEAPDPMYCTYTLKTPSVYMLFP